MLLDIRECPLVPTDALLLELTLPGCDIENAARSRAWFTLLMPWETSLARICECGLTSARTFARS